MMNLDQMQQLIDQLNYYTKLYDEGRPEIDDKTWDDLYFMLQEMERKSGVILANSPTAHIDYQVVNKLNKVTHNHPMLSLDKTKSEEDVLNMFRNKDIIAMAKMDGLTCSIRYIDGKLVSAETRGNGIVGEDITHNIKFVKCVPLEIPVKEEVIVDGEVICTYEDFEDFSSTYKNPRNFASGSIRLLDSRASAQRRLTFVAWDCIAGLDCKTLSEKLVKLDKLGFSFVPFVPIPADMMTNISHIHHAVLLIQESAKEFSYPIDGLVFKFDDCAYYDSLGETVHHARGGLAFKFYDEEYETYLRDIEWSMGKTGQLTPVAIFDEVDDGESIVTRASLHNLNIMEQTLGLNPYYGQTIWVAKMNMIIPQIMRSEHGNEGTAYYLDKKVFVYPDTCPICGGKTIVKDDFLYCDNPNCEGKFINQLVHFVGKKGLDIKGLSEATLQKLVDWGWVGNLIELFNLENFKDEWIAQPGFGEKSVNNLLAAIDNAKNCELWQFISALSIPLIGVTYSKEIARKEYDWHNIREDIEGGFDFTQWDNFGDGTNYSLHNFNYKEADELVAHVLHLKNSLWIDPNAAPVEDIQSSISSKTFVITGSLHNYKNRDLLQKDIEAHGGKVLKGISSNTNYLVSNDKTSTSSKTTKAKSLGIPIITEEELIAMF